MTPAIFLDRDGTLIELVHHLRDPADIRLIPGAADAVRRFKAAGYRIVIITNQSVVGRGMLTLEGLADVHEELVRILAREHISLDGIYFCTADPAVSGPEGAEHPDRKPNPGMLRRAARELDLDLGNSWMIGDSLSDILAGRNAGCAGSILVRTGYGCEVDPEEEAVTLVADDLSHAVDLLPGQ